MIKEQDLLDAIAECQGERNPNANTCIKLAAYYTILNNIIERDDRVVDTGYSFSSAPPVISYEGQSEFAEIVNGKTAETVMPVMDELMETVRLLQPRLYDSVLRKLREKSA